MRHVQYLSEGAASRLVGRKDAVMISITEPGRDAAIQPGWAAVLRVRFVDAEFDAEMLARLLDRGERIDLARKGFPRREVAEELRTFLASAASMEGVETLMVHCHAGRRRSVAVAKFAAEEYGLVSNGGFEGFNRTVYGLLRDPASFDKFDRVVGGERRSFSVRQALALLRGWRPQ